MKKQICNKSLSTLKIVVLFLTVFLSLFLFVPRAKAADTCEVTSFVDFFRFKKRVYCKAKEFVTQNIDISETTNNVITSALIDVPLGGLLQTNADDLGMCSAKYMIDGTTNLGILNSGGDFVFNPGTSGISPMIIPADDIDEIIDYTDNRVDCDYDSMSMTSRSSGSFAGVAMLAYGIPTSQPVPVNLAYYAKHNLQKVPVIGNTAFAQTSMYNSIGLRLILEIWETTRNIAYAMMTVIMLVIGIMISTGKKINPQTIVTAQTALPKIVISLVLITFSYPIGAVFASAVLPLTKVILKIFFQDFLSGGISYFGGQPGQMVSMNALVTIAGLVISLAGGGFVGVLTGTLLIVLTIVALLVAGVKLIIINVKILLQILLAPIQFAMASIPGQEHLITDWFKQMIAKVLAIPAIVFMISLAWYLLIKPFTSPETMASMFYSSFSNWSDFYGTFGISSVIFPAAGSVLSMGMTFILLTLVSMMVMFAGLKADKKIEEFIMGSSGAKGKRK
ncbi:hypothetical protein ACFLZK_02215 [Patescibacteria group bacterium]